MAGKRGNGDDTPRNGATKSDRILRRKADHKSAGNAGVENLAERSLAAIPLLQCLQAYVLRQIESLCVWETFLPGKTVIERGQESLEVFFLVSGSVRVLNFTSSGRVVAFALLGPGDFFGELAAIDRKPRSATVVAETPCRVAILPAHIFRQLVSSYPDMAFSLLQRLAAVIRSCDDRIVDLSSLGAGQRVYLELLRLGKPGPPGSNNMVIDPFPTHASLATGADTTRETVTRIMGRLAEEGIIKRESKALHILDQKRLESLTLQVKDET